MNEAGPFSCASCGRAIEYERPLFCPYCGTKVDPTEGLVDESPEPEIYPASRAAPGATHLLIAWAALVVPVTYFFGRGGFIVLSGIFALCVSAVLLLHLLRSRKERG